VSVRWWAVDAEDPPVRSSLLRRLRGKGSDDAEQDAEGSRQPLWTDRG
jgi:hypothetical protein